jgi:hypothetical protein
MSRQPLGAQAFTGKVPGLMVHSRRMMRAGRGAGRVGRESPSVAGEVMRARWLARAAFVLMFASAAVLIGFRNGMPGAPWSRWPSGRPLPA